METRSQLVTLEAVDSTREVTKAATEGTFRERTPPTARQTEGGWGEYLIATAGTREKESLSWHRNKAEDTKRGGTGAGMD